MSLIRLALDEKRWVSALLTEAQNPLAFLVLAHGAGVGMRHAFMQALAESLAGHGVSVLRYQFACMEWTPWRALAAIQAQWPALRFKATPQYE